MKVINARTNQPQSIPFNLGEKGRGRWLETVQVTNREGQVPSGPEDVGYFIFGEEKKHCILTKSNSQQRGVLLRINTQGTYTRNSSGKTTLIGGDASLLVRGSYAHGDAGNIGGASDELWHVQSPSLFTVFLEGGSSKGFGHRYLIVTRSFESVMIEREDLCQMIATDGNPDVVEVVREFADRLHGDVQEAFRVASELEEAIDIGQVSVIHFAPEGRSVDETIRSFGIALHPATLRDNLVQGVSGVQAGTLMPGTKPLAYFEVGPGGGKRYRFQVVTEEGLKRIGSRVNSKYTREEVLAVVDSPDWRCLWIEYRDGEATTYCSADAGGVHRYSPGNPVWTKPWEGLFAIVPSEDGIAHSFGLKT